MKSKPASLVPNEGIYRKLSVRMYGDANFTSLSPIAASGQSLFIYILTGPHTGPIPGVFVMGRAAMAEALNWDIAAFDAALQEVTNKGMVEFDQVARLWFIPNALKHNLPHNPNVVLSWRSAWPLLPECELRCRIARRFHTLLSGLSPAFGAAFARVRGDHSVNDPSTDSLIGSGLEPTDDLRVDTPKVGANDPPDQERKQDQDKEQEQEQEQEQHGAARPHRKRAAAFDPATVDLPDFIARSDWARWCDDRQKRKKPLTEEAAALSVKKLAEYHADGHSAKAVIDHCIGNGYQGLYAPPGRPAGRPAPAATTDRARVADGARAILLGLQSPGATEVIDA